LDQVGKISLPRLYGGKKAAYISTYTETIREKKMKKAAKDENEHDTTCMVSRIMDIMTVYNCRQGRIGKIREIWRKTNPLSALPKRNAEKSCRGRKKNKRSLLRPYPCVLG